MIIPVKHDGSFDLAKGRDRKEIHWQNKEWLWSQFLEKISTTQYTFETLEQYLSYKKSRQDEIKDVGGFVGGYINGGRRKSGNITHRQLITLDIDFSDGNIWQDYKMLYNNAAAVYSTHKHSAENPRLRLILPLDRPVSTDEYVAISRKIAGDLGINFFDDTTFEPARLMYWPSTSKDAEYVFEYLDGPFLNADEVLSTYRNWKDASEWPVSDRQGEVIKREIKKQGDPLDKPGLVGAFCREYDIHEAIETFLSDVYEPCAEPDRYTFVGGSTAAGLVVYEDKYVYSHHGTDPVSGKLCNSFDLVRVHMFGLQDEDAKEGTASNRMPSFLAMIGFASQQGAVRKRLGAERMSEVKADFAEGYQADEAPNMDWLEDMDTDKKGNYRNTIDNIILIMENDVNLKNKFALNRFENRETLLSSPPWRTITPQTKYITDTDDSSIRHYLEKFYNITGNAKIWDAVKMVIERHAFHPVRDYLKATKWDGVRRVDTLLIDYLGAEDTAYTRAVIRKTLVAAVARVFNPGCKFDYVLVLIGKQGIGKSTIIKLLGRDWFSDSFNGVQGKEAFEQLQGVWILEIAELAGIKKAELESIKHFISKQVDSYRVAYGKRTEVFPRQCVFIGTTNTKDFLSDHTGNRRFWPVDTMLVPATKNIFEDLTPEEVAQVWAEAVSLYKHGEKLYLSKEVEAEAFQKQTEHREIDDRTGIIQRYLDTLLPTNWLDMDIHERRAFLSGDELQPEGTERRKKVCIAEIWVELFGRAQSEMTRYNTRDLHNILKSLPDWEEAKAATCRFRIYGTQKYYLPKNVNNEGFIVYKSDDIVYKSDKSV